MKSVMVFVARCPPFGGGLSDGASGSTWPINTVQFSNHPAPSGLPADQQISALARGIDAIGELGRCNAVLSGYCGSRYVHVLDAVAQ